MNTSEFVSRYIGRFGAFPADVRDEWQLKEWVPIIDAVTSEKLEQVFDAVAKLRGKGFARPKPDLFKDALAGLSLLTATNPFQSDCLYCFGGNLPVLCRKVNGKVFLTDAGPDLQVRFFPCHCKAGANIGHNSGATECLDWVIAKCAEWGIVDTFHKDGIHMSTRWLWACDRRLFENYRTQNGDNRTQSENTPAPEPQPEEEVESVPF